MIHSGRHVRQRDEIRAEIATVVPKVCEHIYRSELQGRENPLSAVRVSFLDGYIEPDSPLEDIVGKPLAGVRPEEGRALLIFLDPDPHANWAHDCWIASFDESRIIRAVKGDFPPDVDDNHELVVYDPSYNFRPDF